MMTPKTMYNAPVTVPLDLSPMAVAGESREQIIEEYLSMVRRNLEIKITRTWIDGVEQDETEVV